MLTRVEDVVRRVQRDYGDENGTQVEVDDILDWINFGQLEVVRQTECLESELQWQLRTIQPSTPYGTMRYGTNGKYSLQLPTDFLKVQRVQFNTSWLDQVEYRDIVDLDGGYVSSFNTPLFYALRDKYLHLNPSQPLAVASTDVVTMYYVPLPTQIRAVSETLSVPANYVQDVIEYCLMKAKEMGEDLQHAQFIGGRLTERLARTRDDGATREDGYDVVRDDYADSYLFYGETIS